jgi:hypothetical protein
VVREVRQMNGPCCEVSASMRRYWVMNTSSWLHLVCASRWLRATILALFSWTAAIVAVLDDHAVACDDQPASGEDACWPCYWPATGAGGEFYPGAVYRINIDNDGDNQAYVAFTFVFSEVTEGKQTGTAWYVTGTQARQAEPGGEVLAEGIPVSFDGTAQPVQVGRPHPAVDRAAQRLVRRCGGCLPCTASSGRGTTTPLRLADQRQDPAGRPQAPRRPADRVPLPRCAEPPEESFLTGRMGRPGWPETERRASRSRMTPDLDALRSGA